jgi:hypothetical protein
MMATENEETKAGQDILDSLGQPHENNVGQQRTWEQAVSMRKAGHSLREIESATGIPRSTLSARFQELSIGMSRDKPLASMNTTDQNLEGESVHEFPPPPSSIPNGYVLKPALTPAEWGELAKLDKPKLMAMVTELKAQNSSLQAQAVMGKGNGDSASHVGSESYIDALGRLVDKVAMQKQAERIVDKMFPEEKKNDDVTRKLERLEDKIERLASPKEGNLDKAVDAIGKVYGLAVGQNQGANPYQIAQNILDLTSKQAQLVKGSTNENDLRREEMRQLGDLEILKLKWEMEKYRDGKQSTADTINAIKEIFQGPVGKVLGEIGGGFRDRVAGGPRVPMAKAMCPNCSAQFSANPKLPQVMCPSCGVMLARSEAPSTTQTTEQPQPEQEPAEKPDVVKKPLFDETSAMDEEVRLRYENEYKR